MSIVQTNLNYTYEIMREDLINLKNKYSFLEMGSIGKSVLGRELYGVKIGNGSKKVFYNAAIHANEWITAVVLMKFIEDYSEAFVNNQNIFGYNATELYNNFSLYLVPMVNPDGVNLAARQKPCSSSSRPCPVAPEIFCRVPSGSDFETLNPRIQDAGP